MNGGSPGRAGAAIAWLGGAAFVGSLGFCAWSYTRVFARAVPSSDFVSTARAVLVNLVLFGAFALHHSIMARTGAKRWLEQRFDPALERSAYVWVSSLLLVLVCAAWRGVPGHVYTLDGAWRWIGWTIQLGGVWLAVRAAAVIDVFELAGIRQARGDRRSPTFKIIGPYHFVRHPIYLGWVLMMFGAPEMTATRFSFAAISTAYLMVAVPFEERSLVSAFGDAYRQYRDRVRWRIVPGVY
jgi:protein-S-isoprenylcysteine O-methyltransferase Ste14